MLAESVHSLADTSNQALLRLGGKRAKRAATPAHPFGYGRERYVYAFIVSIVLFSLWGSRSRPEPVTCSDRQHCMIATVSLRLLCLIFSQLLRWPTLLPRAPSSTDMHPAEVDRRCHATGQRSRPACGEPPQRGDRSPGETAADSSAGAELGVEDLALRSRVRSSSRPPVVHAGDPTHHEHRTGDNSGPGDPGIPVDLQTSGDQVLLDLAELNFAEAEFAALR